jgi:hypothetical protein
MRIKSRSAAQKLATLAAGSKASQSLLPSVPEPSQSPLPSVPEPSQSLLPSVPDTFQISPETVQEQLSEAGQRIAALEAELLAERSKSGQLQKLLDMEKKKTLHLNKALELEQAHSKDLYQKLRVEHRARQRGHVRKGELEDQIKFLRSVELKHADDLKHVKGKASKVVNTLLRAEKENSSLQKELAKCLERCKAEVERSKQMSHSAGKKLRETRMLAARLQKRCERATTGRERAIERARARAITQKSIHSLKEKGVFTEDTRALIRLLVKAGCSRKHIGTVIHAVLKSAGISAIGKISRRTVSRVVLEGYYAAQMQLGYEMQDAKSMYL